MECVRSFEENPIFGNLAVASAVETYQAILSSPRKAQTKNVGVVLAIPKWTVKGFLRSRVPTPPAAEVLRGETTNYPGEIANRLLVFSSCSLH